MRIVITLGLMLLASSELVLAEHATSATAGQGIEAFAVECAAGTLAWLAVSSSIQARYPGGPGPGFYFGRAIAIGVEAPIATSAAVVAVAAVFGVGGGVPAWICGIVGAYLGQGIGSTLGEVAGVPLSSVGAALLAAAGYNAFAGVVGEAP